MHSSLNVYGHRGSAGTHPENTLVSFKAAERACVNGIECDVQLSKDGIPVVIHDEKVDRTTNGVGWVKDYSYEDLCKLDAGGKHSKRYQGERIPTLEEVLTWLSTTSLLINIELKTGYLPYPGIEEKVNSLLNKYHLTDRSVISSFNHYSVKRIYELNNSIETAILLRDKIVHPWEYMKSIGASSIHIEYQVLDEYLMEQTTKRKIPVRVFTVNTIEQMRKLDGMGCDGIFTDYPTLAVNSDR
ncbi:glycerophosphodiester phosphodiesterase [Guptibacillus algicola]|uniref:glycerophosphodiester phosphodiesterase n=1 Tax=Guptibacillus algicola TaxID=225844 RepID=UPI001CD44E25|nr:glycerophosphodiester phosphodiesterase [Alkalihalobacillus algicola]MCA0989026.1 glycerophosphodiester phosphodiesterase [Alkalihalobacillus algicola]